MKLSQTILVFIIPIMLNGRVSYQKQPSERLNRIRCSLEALTRPYLPINRAVSL